ncbi:hypothetical protein [Natrialba asiatica]|uniref:hypothetical protein n=1 Tax=Natrialba asiatica TaxID=64602 RepID=UPI001268B4B3|nr:hypothetical protein [Natrialba asiatica]
MVSRKARLRYIPYGLVVLGLISVWYGYFERFPFLVIGIAAILGAVSTLVRGYTATNLAMMFGVLALCGLLVGIYTLAVNGASVWTVAYLAVGIAAGIRARQYWQAHPWKPEDSNW